MNLIVEALSNKWKAMAKRTLSARMFLSVRKQLHLTQKRMAERLHVHESTILRIEKGRSKPRASLLSRLERLTQKSTRELCLRSTDRITGNRPVLPLGDCICKELNEMNVQELSYLKDKWATEAVELERMRHKEQHRLRQKMLRQELDQGELEEMYGNYQEAQDLLDYLQTTGAPKTLIANQQRQVDALQLQIAQEGHRPQLVTTGEAYLLQMELDQLVYKKQYRLAKVAEIGEILSRLAENSA